MRFVFTHDHRNTMRTHMLTRHPNVAGALAALALIACLATAGCGGSTAASPQDTATTPGPVQDKATAPGVSQATGSHANIVSQCAAKAGSDPASMSICLAAHGLTVQANGELLHCLQSAADASGVTACLTKWAR